MRDHSQKLRRSLAASSAEGIAADILNSFVGGALLTGWALHFSGGTLAIGILGALPYFAQLVHLPSAWITSFFGRRRVAIVAVGLSRQAFLPLIFLPFLELNTPVKLAVLLICAALSSVLGAIGNNAWVAWMADLVPRPIRGRYFGKRAAFCTIGGTLASLIAGYVLDRARMAEKEATALASLALAACIAGAITTLLMSIQHEPGKHEIERGPRLSHALRPFTDSRAKRFLAFQIVWNGSVGLAASFFTMHMLNNLQMGFSLISLQFAGAAIIRVLAAPLWGKAIDRLGARRVLVICSFGIVSIPLVWLFPTPDRLWPLIIDAVLSGTLWSGHALAAFALPLTIAPRQERPFYLAAFTAVAGLTFAIASTCGGRIAEALPPWFSISGHKLFGLQILFVISSLGRLIAAMLSLRILDSEKTARSIKPIQIVRLCLASLGFARAKEI